MNLETE